MDWQKQAEAMMQTWTEAQKKMWESWYDLARNTPSAPSFIPDMTEQWRWLAEQGSQTWTGASGPTIKGVVEQFTASQASMMSFLELVTRTWQAMAPKMETDEDWQAIVADYANQWFQQLVGGPAGTMAASKDLNELWRFYIEEWQKLGQPWLQSWGQAPWQLSQMMMNGGSQLAELSQLHWDAYERTIGRLAETPRLGYTRELNAKLVNAFDTWVEFRQTSVRYHALMAKASALAFERLMQELVALREKGEKIESVRQLLNLWIEVTDQTFTRVYKSEEYLTIQNELARAGMTYRLREQEIVETFLKMMNLPTRSELDDAYRSLYELRKEVKALKKALQGRNGAEAEAQEIKKSSKPPAKRKQTPPKEMAEESSETTPTATSEANSEAVTTGQ